MAKTNSLNIEPSRFLLFDWEVMENLEFGNSQISYFSATTTTHYNQVNMKLVEVGETYVKKLDLEEVREG